MEKAIMVFTRVEADGFDQFISDPELVLALVEDMGFDQDDMLNALSGNNADPSSLYAIMQGRWSGEEVNFSFEKSWTALVNSVAESYHATLDLILSGGRNTQIHNDVGAVMVLSPDQVRRASSELNEVVFKVDSELESSEEAQALTDLFPALQRFFEIAAESGSYVLTSHH